MGFKDFLTRRLYGRSSSDIEEALVRKSSKGFLKRSFDRRSDGQGRVSSGYNFDDMHDFYQDDETFHAGVNAIVDGVLNNGYKFVGSDRSVKDFENLAERNRFAMKLRDALLNGVIYGNAFFEVVKGKSKVSNEIHLLETSFMEIKVTEHGDVEGYVQKPINGGDEVEFSPDEVAHLSMGSVQQKVWGDSDVVSINKVLHSKQALDNHMKWLFEKHKFRDYFTTESGLTNEAAEEFVGTYRKGDEDPDYPLFVEDGKKFEIRQIRDYKDLDVLIRVSDSYESKILRALHVPPIVVGLPDNSNRSNSESQIKAFNIRLKMIQNAFADEINNELIPKLGFSGVKIQFNPVDKRSEKDDIEIAEKLVNMGLKKDAVEHFLKQSGIELPKGELFDKEQPEEVKKPDNMFPSRRPASESNFENFTSGEEGQTREDQMVGKTKDFGDFPYVMN